MRDREAQNLTTPFVSVVMPVRNESASIEQSLSAVMAQDYPPERVEVLVVDGDSSDATREIVERLAKRSRKANVRILRNSQRTVPYGLNLAIAEAKGDVIVRVDGHCVPAPDYVRRCVEALMRTGADNVGGVQRAVGRTPTGRAIALATMSPFGVGNARFRYSSRGSWVDTVYLGAYRREALERIGPFDVELSNNQDDEFNLRLTKAGGRIWLDPSIHVTYKPRESFRALWRQFFRYGLYKVRVLQKSGWASWRHVVPATFVLLLVGEAVVLAVTRRVLWSIAVPAIYIAANLGISFFVARRDPRTLPLLPLTFATLHVAYGCGFLWGVWKWRRSF